mmetsp:Transcript_100773/g.217489  ORF Transcript_100773/g.217489 Transcript_100773/m.217489 type:complete len:149 (+) Transcript_100773:81-527(+)
MSLSALLNAGKPKDTAPVLSPGARALSATSAALPGSARGAAAANQTLSPEELELARQLNQQQHEAIKDEQAKKWEHDPRKHALEQAKRDLEARIMGGGKPGANRDDRRDRDRDDRRDRGRGSDRRRDSRSRERRRRSDSRSRSRSRRR